MLLSAWRVAMAGNDTNGAIDRLREDLRARNWRWIANVGLVLVSFDLGFRADRWLP